MENEIITKLDCKYCGQTKTWKKKTSYLYRVVVAFDQLGNALVGGEPDSSISARAGYFANEEKDKAQYLPYWKLLESIINFTFWPVDGKNHCKDAYKNDPERHEPGSIIAKIFLFLLTLIFTIVISFILYFSWLVNRKIRNKFVCANCGEYME